jgi:ribonuclease HI
MNELHIYIDGASKGNPGHSGIGVVIVKDGQTIKNIAQYIGKATNNIAEYTALIYGLQESLLLKADSVFVCTDSELLYKQMLKLYKVKNPGLEILYRQALHLASGFQNFSIRHIPRDQNKGADLLATKAIKEALRK